MNKFKKAVIIGFVIVAFIAVFDIISAKSGVFGDYEEYMYGDYTEGWWNLFKNLALFVMIGVAVLYYLFYRKDKSEAIAVFLVPYINWRFGLADVLFFWLQGKPLHPTLTWLSGHVPISYFGDPVTPIALYISVLVGISLSLGTAWFLKNRL